MSPRGVRHVCAYPDRRRGSSRRRRCSTPRRSSRARRATPGELGRQVARPGRHRPVRAHRAPARPGGHRDVSVGGRRRKRGAGAIEGATQFGDPAAPASTSACAEARVEPARASRARVQPPALRFRGPRRGGRRDVQDPEPGRPAHRPSRRAFARGASELMMRAPRPRVTKLNAQLMSTSRRFWKPTR